MEDKILIFDADESRISDKTKRLIERQKKTLIKYQKMLRQTTGV